MQEFRLIGKSNIQSEMLKIILTPLRSEFRVLKWSINETYFHPELVADFV
jgi:hypothetical protein